jgi:hypothetical protein
MVQGAVEQQPAPAPAPAPVPVPAPANTTTGSTQRTEHARSEQHDTHRRRRRRRRLPSPHQHQHQHQLQLQHPRTHAPIIRRSIHPSIHAPPPPTPTHPLPSIAGPCARKDLEIPPSTLAQDRPLAAPSLNPLNPLNPLLLAVGLMRPRHLPVKNAASVVPRSVGLLLAAFVAGLSRLHPLLTCCERLPLATLWRLARVAYPRSPVPHHPLPILCAATNQFPPHGSSPARLRQLPKFHSSLRHLVRAPTFETSASLTL